MTRRIPSLDRRRSKALARRLLETDDALASGRTPWRAASRLLERVDAHHGRLPAVHRSRTLEELADRVRVQLTSPEQIDLIIGEFHVSVTSPPPPVPLARRRPPVGRRNLRDDDRQAPGAGPNSGVYVVGEVRHGQRSHPPLPPPPLAPDVWKRAGKG